MMHYVEELRSQVNSSTRTANPIPVGIYARVSTDKDEQKESIPNQIFMAKCFIEDHPNLNLIQEYVDDGISGKNDDNRPAYTSLINDVKQGRIKLIIVKTLSRLNRDELNSLYLVNTLLDNEATVLTLEDGKVHNFDDMNEDLLHNLSFAIDAHYVRQQSKRGHESHQRRCQKKELTAKDICFGYDWNRDTKQITINETEKDYVNRIFEEYVYRNGQPSVIHRELAEEGINLSTLSITRLLQNERYVGNFYINKMTTILGRGSRHSRKVKKDRQEWILVERPDLQIVDTELFSLAQRIRKNRQTHYSKPTAQKTQSYFRGNHLFAGLIFCATCGKQYLHEYTDRKNTRSSYRIRTHYTCPAPSKRVYEADLIDITTIALSELFSNENDIYQDVLDALSKATAESSDNEERISVIKRKRATLVTKRNNLTDVIEQCGTTAENLDSIIQKISTYSEQIKNCDKEIAKLEAIKLDDSFKDNQIKKVQLAISQLKRFDQIDRDRLLTYINRIIVYPDGNIDIIINTLVPIENPARPNEPSSMEDSRKAMPYCTDYDLLMSSFEHTVIVGPKGNKTPKTIKVRCFLKTE